jgi:hypothetical protein
MAIQRYGSDKIIPQYISFYEKILKNSQPLIERSQQSAAGNKS